MCSSDWIALASLAVSLAALLIAVYGIRRANRTAAAAAFVTLNEGFRQSWDRYFKAIDSPDDDPAATELGDLLNLFEIACAMHCEGSLDGNVRTLAEEYMNNILRALVKSDETKRRVTTALLQSKTTFVFIKRFLDEKTPKTLSVTIPPEWYQR
jgi:hypothetical protein